MAFFLLGSVRIDEARVIEVAPRRVRVAFTADCDRPESCAGCTACARSPRVPKVTVPSPDTSRFTPGQAVRVARFAANQALAAFVIFGIPLACALGAAFLAGWAAGRGAQSQAAAVASLFGMAAGFAIAAFIDRLVRIAYPPRIVHDPVGSDVT